MTPAEVRAAAIRRAVVDGLDAYAGIVGDPALGSLRITVNVGAGGAVRSVVVEPQLRRELRAEAGRPAPA